MTLLVTIDSAGIGMELLGLLKTEAVKRGLIEQGTEVDAAKAFALVRDMPYMRASSREPEQTIVEWRGTCSGKHYLLKALFAELGLHSRLIACGTEIRVNLPEMPSELVEVFDAAGGHIVDVHNYLIVELPEGNTVVDATLPLALKRLGFEVNESFVPGEDQRIASVPIGEWEVPDEADPQAFKERLLGKLFTPEQLEHRDRFIRTAGALLAEYLETRE